VGDAKNTTTPWVADGSAEGSDKAVFVASRVGVGSGVFVTVGAMAVCVWKTEAAMVCAPAATVASISTAGSVAAGLPQAASSIPRHNKDMKDRRAEYIVHLM
jgi:hypothetical protein